VISRSNFKQTSEVLLCSIYNRKIFWRQRIMHCENRTWIASSLSSLVPSCVSAFLRTQIWLVTL